MFQRVHLLFRSEERVSIGKSRNRELRFERNKQNRSTAIRSLNLLVSHFSLLTPASSDLLLSSLSTKLVSNSPRKKWVFSMIRRWNGIVVLIPVIKYSLSARAMRRTAVGRSLPTQISLAIIES